MFIYWREQTSKKNKPPKQQIWYEINYYAYLTESVRDKEGKVYHKKDVYLGSIKKIGGKFSRSRRAFFYLNVEERLKRKGFSDKKIRETFKMLRRKIPIPKAKFLEDVRQRKEFIKQSIKL